MNLDGARPRPSVIIPAHNEQQVIRRTLRVLLADAAPDEFDVVVACNGCTDATAETAVTAARELAYEVRVISSLVASKVQAIRAAEQVVTGFPRVYLDADVLCSTDTVRAMVSAVRDGAPLAVPRRVLDTSSSSALARAYYAGWAALPWVERQLAGRGVYTLSRHLRDSFDDFPDVVADDRFATTLVPIDEAVVVPEPVVVRPPGRIADVLRVRRRVYAGNAQLKSRAHDRSLPSRVRGLAAAVGHHPTRLPHLAVFAAVTALAKLQARSTRRDRIGWGRDASRGGASRADDVDDSGPPTPHRARPLDVVVLTYRSAGYVERCLRALDRALDKADVEARVIVVDNASGDGIVEVVEGISPRIRLVLRDLNDGFARGCHAGVELSDADRVLFCNPDAFVDEGTVTELLACADEHPGAGVLGGRSLGPTGELDPRSWWGRPTLWSALCFALGLSSAFPGSPVLDPESPDRWRGEAREVPVVSGGMMLVERDAWDEVGGFDKDFFLYGEDVDFCLRASRAGWSSRVCPAATFQHRVGASSAGSNRLPMVLCGRVTTYRKNLRRPFGALAAELLVLGTGVRAVASGLRPRGGRPASSPQAWRETWRRRGEWRHGWRPDNFPGAVS